MPKLLLRIPKAQLPPYQELVEHAERFAARAYCASLKPYKVGAAVRTFDGKIYGGCNIENRLQSLTRHAEEVALMTAIADGALERAEAAGLTQFDAFKCLAVVVPGAKGFVPCPYCRSIYGEFGLALEIVGKENGVGPLVRTTLEKLCPRVADIRAIVAQKKLDQQLLRDAYRLRESHPHLFEAQH